MIRFRYHFHFQRRRRRRRMTMTMKLGLEKSPKNESDSIFEHDGTIRYFSRNLLTTMLDGFRGRRSL